MRSGDFPRKREPVSGEACTGYRLGRRWACRNARPMATIASGVWELRVRGGDGIFRVFYYTASAAGVLVFHAFAKKTQQTPAPEIELARKHLKELLDA